jgi:hypothetical protein
MTRKAAKFIERAIEYAHVLFHVCDEKMQQLENNVVKAYAFSAIREMIDKMRLIKCKKLSFSDFIWQIASMKELEDSRE